ncbi:hypothetical protein [Virgibacillus ainsalahensis]
MNDKTKNIIVYCVMTIVIALFIYAIFVGHRSEHEKSLELEKSNQSTQKKQTQEVRDYNSNNQQTQGTQEENSEMIKEHHEDMDIDLPDADTLEEPRGFYENHFPADSIADSRQAAQTFTENYYAFRGDEPTEHIEQAKPYMTTELYQELSKETPRPTAAVYRKEVEELNVYEPYEPSEEQFIWKVRVKGKVYDSSGDVTAEENVDYTLKIKQTKGTFKVENYMLNVPY